jgi:UDP-N-acetylmuramate--alanine ligase
MQLMGYRNTAVIFCPHTYTRTLALWDDFAFALSGFSRVFITDVYAAREKPISGVGARELSEAVNGCGGRASYLREASVLQIFEEDNYDAVILMGAGELEKIKEEIKKLG